MITKTEPTWCPHDQLQSWHFEDGTGPVGMWSCKACGLKFVPITETESARAQALEDAAGIANAQGTSSGQRIAEAIRALKGTQ
jgi:hypothetical protein